MPASAPSFVVLKKNSVIHSSTLPPGGVDALYMRCGFKKPDGFRVHATWALPANGQTIFIKVFGKTEGRAGSENKAELPPPVDSTIFYGNVAIVSFIGSDPESAEPTDLTGERWEKLYEILIGGTESLGGATADKEDAAADMVIEEEYELDEGLLGLTKTREGYSNDGFVVEDEDVEESEAVISKRVEEEEEEDDDDDEEEGDCTDDDDETGDDDDESDEEEDGEDELDVHENGVQRFQVTVVVNPLSKKGSRNPAKRKREMNVDSLGVTPPLPIMQGAGDELLAEEYEDTSESEAEDVDVV